MATKKTNETNIRKLTRIGKQSIGLTLPIGMVRELKWKKNRKLLSKKKAQN